jgi:hypothetical protein
MSPNSVITWHLCLPVVLPVRWNITSPYARAGRRENLTTNRPAGTCERQATATEPPTMSGPAFGVPNRGRITCETLAEELRTETTALAILHHLAGLVAELDDAQTGPQWAHLFLRAGGLPAVIRHLRGTPAGGATPNLTPLSCHISHKAGEALLSLLHHRDAAHAELRNITNILPPLLDAMRHAPALYARSAATRVLLALAEAQPKECWAMAAGGVVALVLSLYEVAWELPRDLASDVATPGADLVCTLVRSGTDAVKELREAILSETAVHSFVALLLLQVRCSFPPPPPPHTRAYARAAPRPHPTHTHQLCVRETDRQRERERERETRTHPHTLSCARTLC